jgi:geranylgeranyl diphosphate synthase type I
VDARLDDFFAKKLAYADALSPRAQELVGAVVELTMRGGKRLRPQLIYAGFRATTARETAHDWDAVASLGAAIELLQSYLLMQDDWMDDDDERRGGPSTHAAFARKVESPKLAASLAILASDVAIGFAVELLHATQFPPMRAVDALAAFTDMHFEVVCGQQLDLLGHADVSLTQQLKTGSYTVRGPVVLGAMLAGASDTQVQALERFALPLGVAFQLRDDLLGTFGKPAVTGKPVGHDLRKGKNTALVAEARRVFASDELASLDRVLGNAEATNAEVETLTRLFERSGVRAHVEAELRQRLTQAQRALRDATCLTPDGSGMLFELIERLAVRDR